MGLNDDRFISDIGVYPWRSMRALDGSAKSDFSDKLIKARMCDRALINLSEKSL